MVECRKFIGDRWTEENGKNKSQVDNYQTFMQRTFGLRIIDLHTLFYVQFYAQSLDKLRQ